jgi:DNA-binding MarR family transcriptional regulator
MRSEPGPIVDRPGGNLAIDVFVLDQHVGALLDLALRGTGITPAQYAVYSQFGRGDVSPGQLLGTLGLRPATLSGYLTAMENRGHLTRTRDARDRRSHLVRLTPEGRAARNICRTRFRKAIDAVNGELDSLEEVHAVRLALKRVDSAVLAATTRLRSARSADRPM